MLNRTAAQPFAAVPAFDDTPPNRYQNPRLPFDSANIPSTGFSFTLAPTTKDSPAGSRVRVNYHWQSPEHGETPASGRSSTEGD